MYTKLLKLFLALSFIFITTCNAFATLIPYTPSDAGIINYYGGTALSYINDGNKGTTDPQNYQVHPTNGDGKTITMTFNAVSDVDSAIFYNRTGIGQDRIGNSVAKFYNTSNTLVHTFTFPVLPANGNVNEIEMLPSTSLVDIQRVELTFSGDNQNFREIEFHKNVPVIGDATSPAQTCSQIKELNPSAPDGIYWLKVGSMTTAKQYYCDMTTNGGGWMLLFQRRGGQRNIESCGTDLNDFIQNDCGSVSNLNYGDSYSSNADEVFANFAPTEYMDVQFNTSMTADTDDAFVIKSTTNIFPNNTGIMNNIPVDAVCDINDANCDTTNVYWKYVGDSFFGSAMCSSPYASRASYNPPLEGDFGYCHNGLSGPANSLFGNRQQYYEVKLWQYPPGAEYMERVFIQSNNQTPTNIILSNNSIPENTTSVGNLTTADADTSDTHTYTLVTGTGSDDNTYFTLTTTGGLSFSSAPDFENPSDSDSNNTYTIRVKTTDNGSPNLSFEKVFIVNVTDVVEDASYIIEHYQENLSGNYIVSSSDTQTLTGTIGATVTATPKTFAGYAENTTHADRILTGAILSGGGLTLKLYYQLNEYTVSFSGASIGDQTIKHGGLVAEPTVPTQVGYTFGGWYRDTGFATAHNFATDTITIDTIIYAKWTANTYTLSFSTDGGSSIPNQTITYNNTGSVPTIPTKAGYTFAGWYQEIALTNIFDFTTPITENTTTYAKWTNNPPQFDNITLESNNTKNTAYAKAGDKIKITINLQAADTWRSSYNKPTFSIGTTTGLQTANYLGTNTNPAKMSGYRNYTILSGQNGTGLVFTALQFEDRDGNIISGFVAPYIPTSNIIVDTTLPEIAFSDDVEAGPVLSDAINIAISDTNPDATTYKYGFSSDATCDASDTYGNTLTSGTAFTLSDESNNGKYICVKAEDMAGNIAYKASAQSINIQLNQTPTNIILSNNSIPENTTSVGNLTTTDADTGDTHTYTLVTGTGSDDNTYFTLTTTGGLSFSSAPDFENPSDSDSNNTYTIRVKTTDNGSPNLSFEKVFTIAVTDVNEAPTITDKTFSIAENASNNTAVGVMTGSDVDASDTLSYSIVAGNTGSIFVIDSTTGEIKVSDNTNLDYETTTSHILTIQASDAGGLTDTAIATITITDVDDTPPICGNWTYSPTAWTNGTVTATLSDSTDETAITTTGGTCVLSSNSTTCDVIITDNAGNSTTCTSNTVANIDKTSPVCGNDWTKTPATLTNGSVTMTLSGSADTESGLATSNNYTCSVSTNNSSCDITILDNAGNSTTCTSSTVTNIDSISPTGMITYSMTGWTNSPVTMTLTTNEPIQTPAGWTKVSDTVYTQEVTTNASGTLVITDVADNTENITYEVANIDMIAPVCGNWIYNPTTPTNSAVTATLSGSTDTGGSGINTGGGTCTLTSNSDTCTVNISDNAGNTTVCTSGNVSNIDTTKPTITITAPTKTYSQTIGDTTILIEDNRGILSSAISASGGTIVCMQVTPSQVNCTTTITSSGDLTITATDQAGNINSQKEVDYTIRSSINGTTGPGGGYNNHQPVTTKKSFLSNTQFLPTQSKAIPDGMTPSGQKVFTIQNRVTNYVCPKIVQVYTTDEINAIDIKNTNFHDDIRALIMFRGLEKDEKNLGQTFKEYQSYGVNLNTNGFRPYEHITRAEYVKMLVRSLSCRYTYLGKDTPYTDISQNDWHAEYIKFATEQGWISGYDDGTFKPNNPITRNEAAKIFSRAIRLQTASAIANPYLDVSEGSEFLPYIKSLRESGIMKGKTGNMFSPETYIPRTEASRMIYRTFLGGEI